MHTNRTLLAAALTAASLAAAPAAAQSLMLPPAPEKGVWLETSYTDFKGVEVSFPSSVWYLSARLPLTGGLTAMLDVPFSHGRAEIGAAEETSSVLGNPYVGVELAATDRLGVQLGTRLPLTTADGESFADVLAFVSDPMRAEAFLEDVVPVTAAAAYTRQLSPAFGVRARGGGTALFYTGEAEDTETETTVDYGVSGTYTAGAARVSLGVTGRWLASEDQGSFAENSFHQVGAAADVLVRGIRPGISVRLPLDRDFREVMSSSVGLYLQVPLR